MLLYKFPLLAISQGHKLKNYASQLFISASYFISPYQVKFILIILVVFFNDVNLY